MRTTVAIDDDVLARARSIARARRVAVGRVLSDLARRGLALPIEERDGIPCFRVPPDARRITSDDVRRAEDDG